MAIKKDCDIYIDSMLCLVHAKASQEIESFKRDVVIGSYANFLVELVDGLYRQVLRAGNFEDSFLKFIAFEQPSGPELSCFGFGGECSQFQVALLGGDTNRAELHRGLGRWIPYQAGKIQYDSYRPNHVAAVRELRDLLYKVRSLKKLVVRLKEGNLEWESGEEAVRTLSAEILMEKPKYPRLA